MPTHNFIVSLIAGNTWMTTGGALLCPSVTSPEDSVEDVLRAVLSDEPVSVIHTSLVLERRRRLPSGGMVDGQACFAERWNRIMEPSLHAPLLHRVRHKLDFWVA